MKNLSYYLFITVFTSLAAISCSKEDDVVNPLIADEVAEEIAASLGNSNSGISSEVAEMAQLADAYSETTKSAMADTLISVDTLVSRKNPSGTLITYEYTYQMEYGYIFDGGNIQMYYNGSASGYFDAPRIASSDSRESSWILTGFEVSAGNYILNGTTSRTGNSRSKVGNEVQITSASQIVLSDIHVNKSTLAIESGSLSWEISGMVDEQSFSYTAVVYFEANETATLSLEGNVYTINLSAGEVE